MKDPEVAADPSLHRVSVVIPLGKAQGDVVRCVQSALQQTHAPCEVIVVANHSVSAAQAQALLKPLLYAPQVQVIDGSACRNANDARNLGARSACAEWIALLDSDDWWEPQHLAASLRCATLGEERVELVYGSIRVHDANGASVLLAGHFSSEQTAENYLLSYRPAQTSTFLVSKRLMLEQPWSPSLRRHQDYEWFARVARHCGVRVTEEVTVNVEWLAERKHQAHRDCWAVVAPWRACVQRVLFRRHHRSLIKSALRSRDPFALRLIAQYALDSFRGDRHFLQR